jgi:predicted O-methyltransferase YrrM
MKFFSATVPGNSPSHLVKAYPWASLGSATIVDIGGADGYVSALLARTFPSLHLTVQDLPHIAAEGRVPDDLEGRMEFQVQDFFTEQSVKGADVYLLRWVLHDWPDKYAIQILRQLVPALRKGAKVVINDNVGPGQSGILPLMAERFVR